MARQDGAMLGPYNAMLHFPQFGEAVWSVNTALAKHSTLPKNVHELVVLVAGARFTARYEIYAHEYVAAGAGLSQSKIASLAAGSRPGDLTAEEAVAFDAASVLMRGAQLPDSSYQATVAAFGETGTAELIFPAGFYCLISVILNGYDVAVPGRDETTE